GDAESWAVGGEFTGGSNFGPSQRHGDAGSGAGAGRVGGDGCGTALVAQVVEVDAAGAGGLGHFSEIEAGVRLLHAEDEAVSEVFRGGPVEFGFDGDDDVEAFAAGGLEETGEAEVFEARSDLGGGFGDGRPGEGFVGVEVEDEAVGMFEIGVARAPGVDFEDA